MANGFKQIQVSENDWNDYKKLAAVMTKELGVKVYINGAVKRAVSYYKVNTSKTK